MRLFLSETLFVMAWSTTPWEKIGWTLDFLFANSCFVPSTGWELMKSQQLILTDIYICGTVTTSMILFFGTPGWYCWSKSRTPSCGSWDSHPRVRKPCEWKQPSEGSMILDWYFPSMWMTLRRISGELGGYFIMILSTHPQLTWWLDLLISSLTPSSTGLTQ